NYYPRVWQAAKDLGYSEIVFVDPFIFESVPGVKSFEDVNQTLSGSMEKWFSHSNTARTISITYDLFRFSHLLPTNVRAYTNRRDMDFKTDSGTELKQFLSVRSKEFFEGVDKLYSERAKELGLSLPFSRAE
ncbi:MAG: hypothetical protein ACPF8V_09510, partial [Luteibaculum sp.]